MITNKGKQFIYGYMSKEYASWAGKIALGVGESAPSPSDTDLEFKLAEAPVDLTVSDISTNSIIVRALLDAGITGTFTEVGLYAARDPDRGQLLVKFSPDEEEFTGGVQTMSNYRIGRSAVITSAGTVIRYLYSFNLEQWKPTDTFSFAANNTSGEPVAVTVRLKTTVDDYLERTFMFMPGYSAPSYTKNSFIAVGSPTWSIQELEFIFDGALIPDGFRINDQQEKVQQGLVARSLLPVPVVKTGAQQMDVEYKVAFNFG